MNFRVCDSMCNSDGFHLVIFFQGCLKHCKGCNNKDSWPMYGGTKMDTNEFKKMIANDPNLIGIILSGGEPFLQPQAALDLAKFAHSRKLKVWCYSGYTLEEILEWEDNRKLLLKEIDILVDGPYEEDKKCNAEKSLFCGSYNQRIIDVPKSLEKGCAIRYDTERDEHSYAFQK